MNFELPEALGELSAAELTELLAAARADAASLMSDLATADLDRLEVLADAIDTLTEALSALEVEVEVEDDADHDARAAALAARFAVDSDVDDVDEVEADVAPVVEAIAASAATKRPAVKRPAAKLNLPAAKKNSAIVAATGLPTMTTLTDVVPNLIRAWDGLKGAADGRQTDVFSITLNYDEKLVANGRNDNDVVAYAINQARLGNGEGLLAAGGWCAPAEQRYDICDLSSLSGILDLPSISVPRGSISYFRELDYRTTVTEAAAGFACYTVPELEALPPLVKPCVEVPCKEPVTFELGACSFCIRAGVLQRRAFPELVEAWVSQALKAYQHFLNAKHIAEILALVALAGPTVVIPGSFGAIVPFLDALDLQATNLRYDLGMSNDAVIEGFAPWWLPVVFRADAAKRQFNADYNLTQSQINSYLAARNIRLQWVEDFNDAPFAGNAPVTTLPTTVDVVLYNAGAYLNASDNIVRVGALQDSTLLTTNREQILFVETSEGILPACGHGIRVTIPLCASGETAGPVDAIGANNCG